MKPEKALSLTQPMAWAIFHGKDVENRHWQTKFRGRIYIHASQGFDKEHYDLVKATLGLTNPGLRIPKPEDFVHGALIGEVDIVDCTKEFDSLWAMNSQWHFKLKNATEYAKPIPCRGALGFFTPDIEVKANV